MLNINSVAEFVNTKCSSLRHLALHCVTPATEDGGQLPPLTGETDSPVQDCATSGPSEDGAATAQEGQPQAPPPPVAKKVTLAFTPIIINNKAFIITAQIYDKMLA